MLDSLRKFFALRPQRLARCGPPCFANGPAAPSRVAAFMRTGRLRRGPQFTSLVLQSTLKVIGAPAAPELVVGVKVNLNCLALSVTCSIMLCGGRHVFSWNTSN